MRTPIEITLPLSKPLVLATSAAESFRASEETARDNLAILEALKLEALTSTPMGPIKIQRPDDEVICYDPGLLGHFIPNELLLDGKTTVTELREKGAAVAASAAEAATFIGIQVTALAVLQDTTALVSQREPILNRIHALTARQQSELDKANRGLQFLCDAGIVAISGWGDSGPKLTPVENTDSKVPALKTIERVEKLKLTLRPERLDAIERNGKAADLVLAQSLEQAREAHLPNLFLAAAAISGWVQGGGAKKDIENLVGTDEKTRLGQVVVILAEHIKLRVK